MEGYIFRSRSVSTVNNDDDTLVLVRINQVHRRYAIISLVYLFPIVCNVQSSVESYPTSRRRFSDNTGRQKLFLIPYSNPLANLLNPTHYILLHEISLAAGDPQNQII